MNWFIRREAMVQTPGQTIPTKWNMKTYFQGDFLTTEFLPWKFYQQFCSDSNLICRSSSVRNLVVILAKGCNVQLCMYVFKQLNCFISYIRIWNYEQMPFTLHLLSCLFAENLYFMCSYSREINICTSNISLIWIEIKAIIS